MMTKGSMSYGMNRDDTSVSILSRIFDNGPSALLAQDAVGQLEETRRPGNRTIAESASVSLSHTVMSIHSSSATRTKQAPRKPPYPAASLATMAA